MSKGKFPAPVERLRYRFNIIVKVFPYAAGVKRFFVLLIIINLFSMAAALIAPQFYKLFVDEVIIGSKINLFPIVIAGYLGIFAVTAGLSYAANYASNRLENRLLYRIKRKILDNYFDMPFTTLEQWNTGDLQMRIDNDANGVAGFPTGQIINYFISMINLIIAAVLLFAIEWRLAAFSVIVIPLTFFADDAFSKREKILSDINRENSQNMQSWLQNSISGWKEVKALNLQTHETRVYARYLHNFARYYGRWIHYWTARVMIIPTIKDDFLMKFSLYFFGGLLIMNGNMTIGSLLVFMIYYSMLSDQVNGVSGADANLQSSQPVYGRVLEELERTYKTSRKNLIPDKSSYEIKFDGVSFTYPGTEKPVLENLNFIISKGERVAIAGKSGAGKTTAVKLAMGMLSPDSGIVSFSGISAGDIDPNYLYGEIGFVMQENLLFNLSVRENLLLADSRATEEELNCACEKACILDFIRSLPDGYETVIGERGVKLSGGQRQRIVLARLFLRDINVFIFDEATSSLDQYSENIIQDAIKNIARDKTVIIIAHRESSVSLCERKILINHESGE